MKKKGKKKKTISKKESKKNYRLFIGLVTLYVLHYLFIESQTIGKDSRYFSYVFALPTIIGTVVIAYFKRKQIFSDIKGSSIFQKVSTLTFLLIQGLLVAYLSFGLVAKATWDCLNKVEARKNKVEVFYSDITEFHQGSFSRGRRRPKVYFRFQKHHEDLKVARSTIREYIHKNPSDYRLKLSVKKGIWNYYIVQHFAIILHKKAS